MSGFPTDEAPSAAPSSTRTAYERLLRHTPAGLPPQRVIDGSRRAVESATGTVAGSVAVTPATRLLDGEQSPPIDMLSAATCSLVVHIAAPIPFDDDLGTLLHPGGGGMVGALPTGSLVSKPLVPGDYFPMSTKILEESGHFGLIIAKINTFSPPMDMRRWAPLSCD